MFTICYEFKHIRRGEEALDLSAIHKQCWHVSFRRQTDLFLIRPQ